VADIVIVLNSLIASPLKKMDSLTLKIHSFMNHAGSSNSATDSEPSKNALEMVQYFEEEYDLQMMSFLEKEWLIEQVDRDLSYGEFSDLRNHVPESRREGFDKIVSAIYE